MICEAVGGQFRLVRLDAGRLVQLHFAHLKLNGDRVLPGEAAPTVRAIANTDRLHQVIDIEKPERVGIETGCLSRRRKIRAWRRRLARGSGLKAS